MMDEAGWAAGKECLMEMISNRLDRVFEMHRDEYEQKALAVLRSGWYVLGPEVKAFEEEFAAFTGGKFCVGLASGLDALWLAFRVLGIGKGDEVIVQANTYIASVMGITINGATPVFVEPGDDFQIDPEQIERAITKNTKAVLVVHLYGQAANMGRICEICHKHGLRLVEDCAQSHGAEYRGKMTGTFGDIGCFSYYPSKNLGAFGDAGAIVTDSEEICRAMKMYRNYGSEKRYYNKVVGANSRLDELQAGLLRVRLKHLAELTEERKRIARAYLEGIDNPLIRLPAISRDADCVWHQFVVRCDRRDELMEHMAANGVGSIIHYPIPPHLSEAYGYLGFHRGDFPITEGMADTVVSIPIYNGMTNDEIKRVVEVLCAFS